MYVSKIDASSQIQTPPLFREKGDLAGRRWPWTERQAALDRRPLGFRARSRCPLLGCPGRGGLAQKQRSEKMAVSRVN